MDDKQKTTLVYYFFIGIGALMLIGLIALLYLPNTIPKTTETSVAEKDVPVPVTETNNNESYENLAQCLTAKGAVLYGASWCPHCRNQKALFNDTVNDLKYVECQAPNGGQTEECAKAGIKAYPTWIINGRQYLGERSLEELMQLTGCQI